MGSVREGAEAMVGAANEFGALNDETAGVPAPANPLPPNQMPGTPEGPPPKSPVGEPDASGVPTVDVDAVPERSTKKARLEKTEENMEKLTDLVKETVKGMQDLKESVLLTQQQQQQLQSKLDKLAAQLGTDSVSTRVIYNTLNEFQRSLTNGVWQLAGGKRDAQTSCKEVLLRMEDFMKQCATRLLEQKNETRAQNAVTVTSVKECTNAVKGLEAAIRAGTELNAATAATPAVPPAAPAVEVNPPAPKAAPATPAPPMSSGNEPHVAAPSGPGYASAAVGRPGLSSGATGTDSFPPPMYTAPPPAGYRPPGSRAGRLRIQGRDGTIMARAVSPNGRHPGSIDQTWSSEYGLGTVTFSGRVFRILPDAFLDGSLPMN